MLLSCHICILRSPNCLNKLSIMKEILEFRRLLRNSLVKLLIYIYNFKYSKNCIDSCLYRAVKSKQVPSIVMRNKYNSMEQSFLNNGHFCPFDDRTVWFVLMCSQTWHLTWPLKLNLNIKSLKKNIYGYLNLRINN